MQPSVIADIAPISPCARNDCQSNSDVASSDLAAH
jgi:hypothetical protein